ncbi:MAG: hypothetical protein ABL925_14075 [Methylococcales bacterium]
MAEKLNKDAVYKAARLRKKIIELAMAAGCGLTLLVKRMNPA